LLATGCASPPKPKVTGKLFELQLLSQEKCPLPSKPGAPERAALGIKVRLVGLAPEGVAANYFYASLLSHDGSRYLAELPGCGPVLGGAPLYPGETREGYFNIPLPAHKQARSLVYAPPIGTYPAQSRTVEIPLESGRALEDQD
jgi:hypothetical protein